MDTQLIHINGKDYQLKFGYGAFRVLGQIWKVATLEATGEKIANAFKGLDSKKQGAFGYEQMDVLSEMIYSAIIAYDPTAKTEIDTNDVATQVLRNPNELTQIIELYMASISSMLAPQGKPQPQARKKRQTVKK